MLFTNTDEERKYFEFLDYLFKHYLTFYHSFGLRNQDHYMAILNGDSDATKNTSESNKCLKTQASTGKKSTLFSDQFTTTKWITIKEQIPVNNKQNADQKN